MIRLSHHRRGPNVLRRPQPIHGRDKTYRREHRRAAFSYLLFSLHPFQNGIFPCGRVRRYACLPLRAGGGDGLPSYTPLDGPDRVKGGNLPAEEEGYRGKGRGGSKQERREGPLSLPSCSVQMRKATRSIWAAAAAAPLPFPAIEEESRAKFRLRNLMQECVELQKETVAKKRRLQMGKHRLLTLNGEVRFLRRRYKYLTKNSSTGLFRMKDRPQKNLTRIEHKSRKRTAGISTQFTSQQDVPYGRQIDREPPVPSSSAVIDLNKTLLPEGEGETHVALYPSPSQKSSKNNLSDEGGTPGNQPKSLLSLDVGTGTNGIARKKMSCKDQVAFMV